MRGKRSSHVGFHRQVQAVTTLRAAVLDQMREASLAPVAVTITGGRFTSYDGLHWRVPKQALLRPLVAAMDAGRLKVAKGLREAEALQNELQGSLSIFCRSRYMWVSTVWVVTPAL